MKFKTLFLFCISLILVACQEKAPNEQTHSPDLLVGKFMNAEFDLCFTKGDHHEAFTSISSIEEELETAPKDVRFEFYVKAWYLKGRLGVEESFGWTHLVNADWDDFKKTLELIVDDLEKGKTPEPSFAKGYHKGNLRYLKAMRNFMQSVIVE